MSWDAYGQLKPSAPPGLLKQQSEALSRTCPFSPHARNEDEIAAHLYPQSPQRDSRLGHFEDAYVGHAAEAEFRASGSSGGLVSWVAAELLTRGLVDGVAHVVPSEESGRFFAYRISRTEQQVRTGAKSRYYPIELSEVIEEMRSVPGRYAVVGIPCFIKAINLLRLEDTVLQERIRFTLGLFCGHMKSARMVESFAWQLGVAPQEVARVDYRLKNPDRPANWYTAYLELKDGRSVWQDWWHLVDGDWGAGFFQNSACDFCDDVVAETADISFGDAWVEPYSSDGRGTNVVIVRSSELAAMVKEGIAQERLALTRVDADFVAETQAAGLRHRREGLRFRLARRHRHYRPSKRVAPAVGEIDRRRRTVYATRRLVSRWSHRVFGVARLLNWPGLYLRWGRLMLAYYQGITYSRGRIGAWFDRLDRAAPEHRSSEP